jgi:predicted RNA-binding Zn-ribbon protein involved in translation (DUF1610 family)
MQPALCFVCEHQKALIKIEKSERYFVQCPQCGEFRITRIAHRNLKALAEFRYRLSGIIREQVNLGDTPIIEDSLIDRLPIIPDPSFLEKGNRLLSRMIKKIPYITE